MAIMYKYTMGELPDENNMGYGNTKKKQGDSKTNVVKGGAALPAPRPSGCCRPLLNPTIQCRRRRCS